MKNAAAIVSPFWSITNAIARKILAKKAHRFDVPVISIGNVVAGGVGKTEVVIKIAQTLSAQGKRVVVASRGYGSEWSKKGGIAQSFQEASEKKFPDEALVALSKVGALSMAVGADRTKVLLDHWQELKPDVILLDDGFQHFKIARDLDILVHDFSIQNPVLRDMPSYFSKVGARVCFSEVPKLWQKLDWTRAFYKLDSAFSKKFHGSEVIAFCGIGNPSRFTNLLQENGIKIVAKKFFKDHKNYTTNDIEALVAMKQKLEAKRKNKLTLVTTRKDWVKLPELLTSFSGIDIQIADVELQFTANEAHLFNAIDETLAKFRK